MSIHSKRQKRKYSEAVILVAAFILSSFFLLAQVNAEPYLALRANQKCSACHVNPLGGGARTAFGSYYGSQVLPAVPGNQQAMDAGQITETLRLGADLRFNMNMSDNDAEEESRSFNTQSGQLYFTLQPKDSRFLIYFDEQIAPGGAVNREAWGLAKLGKSNHYIKAGSIMLPYGYRFEDDSAFVRQISNVTFDSNDTGVELGLEYGKGTVNFAITNGTAAPNNDDKNFQFATRAEYVGTNIRGGASYILNDADLGETRMFAVFGGFNLWGFNVLAEFDHIEDESSPNAFGGTLVKQATLFEINREIVKGYNIKFTTEYLDDDEDLDENEKTRNSLLLEATPFAYAQIRGGVRVGEDIPQNEEGNFTQAFVQLHLYY